MSPREAYEQAQGAPNEGAKKMTKAIIWRNATAYPARPPWQVWVEAANASGLRLDSEHETEANANNRVQELESGK